MTSEPYEVVSTRSWNVLGTFDAEAEARTAVRSSLNDGGAHLVDLVVYHGEMILVGQDLTTWLGEDGS